MKRKNRYSAIIEKIFTSKFKPGMKMLDFAREEFETVARQLRIKLPKNLGDLVYSFRYRANLPEKIRAEAGKGEVWIIRPIGKARYRLALVANRPIQPNANLATTKVPDATPGIVTKYAFDDEQALLARLRYNRLVDVFTSVTCYSLQNHLRTVVPDMGQVETDELYVGLDKKGVHYIFPIQAKGGTDKLNVVQIEQDFAVCANKFPGLICRPIGTQFMDGGIIALFEFEQADGSVRISTEKHYKLVPPEEVTKEDLENYRQRTAD
ncbi:MAG: endonuclease [Verrucomicrobiota bacterium]|nr:endonuclease [Verrucomicrobiota bacterium]